MGFISDIINKFFGDGNNKVAPQSIDLDKLIDAALADGVVTDEEHAILLKKVKEVGMDVDEFELLLNGKIAEANKKAAMEKAAMEKAELERKMAEEKAAEEKAEAEKAHLANTTVKGFTRLIINYVSTGNKVSKKTIALPKKVTEYGDANGYDSIKVVPHGYMLKLLGSNGEILMDKDIFGWSNANVLTCISTITSYEWSNLATEFEPATNENSRDRIVINYLSGSKNIRKVVAIPKQVTTYGDANGYDSIVVSGSSQSLRLTGKSGEVLMNKEIIGFDGLWISSIVSHEWTTEAAEKARLEMAAEGEGFDRLIINYVSSANKIGKKTVALPKQVTIAGNIDGYDSLKITISGYKLKIQSATGEDLMDKDIVGSGYSIKTVNSYEWVKSSGNA